VDEPCDPQGSSTMGNFTVTSPQWNVTIYHSSPQWTGLPHCGLALWITGLVHSASPQWSESTAARPQCNVTIYHLSPQWEIPTVDLPCGSQGSSTGLVHSGKFYNGQSTVQCYDLSLKSTMGISTVDLPCGSQGSSTGLVHRARPQGSSTVGISQWLVHSAMLRSIT